VVVVVVIETLFKPPSLSTASRACLTPSVEQDPAVPLADANGKQGSDEEAKEFSVGVVVLARDRNGQRG
jgi:hypothetical protein